MRQEHRAGEKLFIDFCGSAVPVINPDTGEIRRVVIFVAVMGASNYTYVEACEGQDMMSWLNSLTFPGGVPKLLIPDNLRSAVKKADRYEPVINDSYQALAEHYGTVIIPARPRKPKAENGVLIVERWLLARIRNETFHTLRALNARLRELLTDMNNRPMKGYGNQPRAERFRMLDAPALSPLPLVPYGKSGKNCAEMELVRLTWETGITINAYWKDWAISLRQNQKKLIMLLSETRTVVMHTRKLSHSAIGCYVYKINVNC